jgi:CRISPR-associated protein Csm1
MDEITLKIAVSALLHDIGSQISDEHLPLQSKDIIAEAGKLSSGGGHCGQFTKNKRLLPIFEHLMPDREDAFDSLENFSYCYPLKALSPKHIFPKLKAEIINEDKEDKLEEDFLNKVQSLRHKAVKSDLWFEHIESLMMAYLSSVPARFPGNGVSDISIYDHARTTSALSVAIYLYHRHHNSIFPEAIQNSKDKKFLLINGNFQGIQNFIFGGYGDARKYRSKILRGRSFAVSLLSELAADMLCRKFGLPSVSVVLNAAGRFTLIAPNIPESEDHIHAVKKELDDWLFKVSYGQTLIIFTSHEASADDFVSGEFAKLWEKIGLENEEKKFSRIDLDQYGGTYKEYLNSFDNSLDPPLCSICGKRPATRKSTGSSYVTEARSSCDLCRDHVFLGTKLVKSDILAITRHDADIHGEKLFEPLFGKYQVFFPKDQREAEKSRESGILLKYWQLGIDSEISEGSAVKFIKGYVPEFTKDDKNDKQASEEIIGENYPGNPKTLNLIACKAKNPTKDEDKFCGIEALGVLKADVDNLGMLMACGLKPEQFTISRVATLSRQLNFYFAVYLPDFLKTEKRFNDIYTVFAGGDDLFLIGPWNHIIALVAELEKSFAEYVCRNKEIHFSAGMTLHKAHTTIASMAKAAEHALEQSKHSGKNCLTLFSETVSYDELGKLHEIREKLQKWLNEEIINNAMLYRLNDFIDMVKKEKQIIEELTLAKKSLEFGQDQMSCTKWRSLLAYFTGRNVAKGEPEREKIVHGDMKEWLETYGGKLKIALWDILYNSR